MEVRVCGNVLYLLNFIVNLKSIFFNCSTKLDLKGFSSFIIKLLSGNFTSLLPMTHEIIIATSF